MNYNNFHKLLKKKVLAGSTTSSSSVEAIEGGVVLILSNTFPDGLKRVYMGIINRIRLDNDTNTIRVDLYPQYYILKAHLVDKIYPEKVFFTKKTRLKVLGMETNGLYLNDNKCPLWQISCEFSKIDFFNKYQSTIKDIINRYDDIIFPYTQLSKYPNLHENVQISNKLYFKTGKINKEEEDLILSITNGDNFTKLVCDLFIHLRDITHTSVKIINKYLFDFHYNLKNYNKNIFPVAGNNLNGVHIFNLYCFLRERNDAVIYLKLLPSIAIRNLKKETRKIIEEPYVAIARISDIANKLREIGKNIKITEKSEKYNTYLKKIFNSNNSLDKMLEISKHFLKNYNFGLEEFNLEEFLYYAKADNYIIQEDKNILVIKVESYEDMIVLGEGTLWCFALPYNEDTWEEYATLGYVYVVIDLRLEYTESKFMMVYLPDSGRLFTSSNVNIEEVIDIPVDDYLTSIGVKINLLN